VLTNKQANVTKNIQRSSLCYDVGQIFKISTAAQLADSCFCQSLLATTDKG